LRSRTLEPLEERSAPAASAPGRRAPSRAVEIEWLEELNQVAALESEWRELESRVDERLAFGSFDFQFPWYRHMAEAQGAPLVGVARRGGSVVGILPLARRSATLGRVPVRRADSAGHDADVGEILFARDECEALETLLASLFDREALDLAAFVGIEPGSWRHSLLEDFASREGRSLREIEYRYATIEMPHGYDAYFGTLGAKLRANLRRRQKRGDEMGGVSLDRVVRPVDRATLSRYMDRVFGIYERSWKADGADPIQDYHRRFYAEVAERFNRRGMLDLSILTVGGRDASFILGIREGTTYHDLTISYDDTYAPLSPGTLLMQEVAKRCSAEGIRRIISHGDREYKRYWASRWVPQVRALVFAPGLRAGLARFARFEYPRLAAGVKRLVRPGSTERTT
jgi:CelD/BcsL family acetyltransferase involved in cellulose biosynthesis